MTFPPPPSGNPGPPPQYGSGDPFGPSQGGPAGYPGSQGGSPQWQQPPAWAPNPGAQQPGPPPKKRGNGWKWGLGGVALLAVIGVTAAISISVVKGDGDGGKTTQPLTSGASQSPTASNSDIASANDTGPTTIITEDPTCAAWIPISNSIGAAQTKAHWADHDYTIPAASWTPELRAMYETVSNAMTTAADQSVALLKKTPHRVMREFYEQFIAYSRGFANSLSSYVAADNYIATVASNAYAVILYVCQAIDYKSAAARMPFVSDPAPPSTLVKPGDVNNPQRFMPAPDEDCSKWQSIFDKFDEDTGAWAAIDTNLSSSDWTSDQRAVIDSVTPVIKKYADDIEDLARSSNNPTVADFGVFSAQYWRAYLVALSTYTKADAYLAQVAGRSAAVIVFACRTLGE